MPIAETQNHMEILYRDHDCSNSNPGAESALWAGESSPGRDAYAALQHGCIVVSACLTRIGFVADVEILQVRGAGVNNARQSSWRHGILGFCAVRRGEINAHLVPVLGIRGRHNRRPRAPSVLSEPAMRQGMDEASPCDRDIVVGRAAGRGSGRQGLSRCGACWYLDCLGASVNFELLCSLCWDRKTQLGIRDVRASVVHADADAPIIGLAHHVPCHAATNKRRGEVPGRSVYAEECCQSTEFREERVRERRIRGADLAKLASEAMDRGDSITTMRHCSRGRLVRPELMQSVTQQRSQQDIRSRDAAAFDLRAEIVAGLSKEPGERSVPTVVLYDEPGLRLYDEITTKAKEYYLFASEEEILRKSAGEVVVAMSSSSSSPSGATVLELGAGALRKTSHLLRALAKHAPGTTYYALDLEHRELVRTLDGITAPGSELAQLINGRVAVRGLCGTYEDGIRLLNQGALRAESHSQPLDSAWDLEARGRQHSSSGSISDMSSSPSRNDSGSGSDAASSGYATPPTPLSDDGHQPGPKPLHILFLGSSIGNFPRDDAAAFLRSLPLRPGDTLLLGLDGRNAKELVEPAYHDPAGHTERFIMNGLKSAARVLGVSEDELSVKNWVYESRFNEELGRHEAYYKCTKPHTLKLSDTQTVSFTQDELVHIENAYKYSDEDAHALFDAARLRPVYRWQDSRKLYSLYLLERPPFHFPLIRQPLPAASPFGLPSMHDWHEMWRAWDGVTLGMIPRGMLHVKPIDLRHICLFYLGHIPAFLDIHLSRLLRQPHTEPERYKDIFERGIDPHVDDPNQCHPHSEVPQKMEDWPSLEEILAFRDRVRERVMRLYEEDEGKMSRKMARVLFMTLEHEGFHAETLLYMLLQRAPPSPSPSTLPPPGFAPPPWELLQREWDALPCLAEHERTVELGPAEVELGHDDVELEDEENVPYTPGDEFGWDNESPRRLEKVARVKISWRCITNGEYLAFWEERKREVETPKSWVLEDGSAPKVRTLYGAVDIAVARDWPVLASYDALDAYARAQGGRLPTEPELRLFGDLYHHTNAANVGFKRWHPVPATTGPGKGHNGGAWEWTSTVLAPHEGFVPSKLYPGYTSDFFDGKHMVVLGGSYATVPRIAQRRSVRNFYQHNYPYAWVAGRVVYDV